MEVEWKRLNIHFQSYSEGRWKSCTYTSFDCYNKKKCFSTFSHSLISPPPLFIRPLISSSQSISLSLSLPLTNALFHVLSYFSLSLLPSFPHPDVSWLFCRPSTFLGVMWSPLFLPRVVHSSHSNNKVRLNGVGEQRRDSERTSLKERMGRKLDDGYVKLPLYLICVHSQVMLQVGCA